MKVTINKSQLNDKEYNLELAASVKLELIQKMTEDFSDWNDCTHDEYNTGYMNCLIDVIHTLANQEV
ncbi:hypothetical protein [Lactococcus sp. DD01]|uniref:hypothetical protein n=1 Tax=Lactococcus sp. DD01 TaxID=1776443 RepID=UPI0007765FF7|nr:hypothetical protein [Lactococcus sp. DD01]KXT63205.1 hypothetical protein LACDD01_00149 [Lactococcus sp. DD01]